MLWVFALALVGFTTADYNYQRTDGSYFITHSMSLQRDVPFTVAIDILNTTAPVHVRAEIQRVWSNYTQFYRIPIAMAEGDFTKGKTGKLSINTPEYLQSGSYRLHVRGSNGLQFEREVDISLQSKTISIMIQTDKAMYKPGQKVHFRAFGVYPDLKVYTGKFDITLSDPNSNILKRWVAVDSASGVVEGEFQLADQPLLGDWKLMVEAEEQKDKHSKTFTVAEYQLPRFEVTVELPPYSLATDEKLSGTVKTKYTFGKPVKGMVELHAHLDTSNDYCGRPPKYVELAFPTDGETKFDIPTADLKRLTYNLQGNTFVVVAIVKEELTGARLNGSSSVTFYQHPYKIEVLSSSPKTFSPKLPYTAYIKVSQQDGRPVTDIASPVSMHTCVHYRIVQDDQSEYGCSDFSGTYGLPSVNYTILASGIIPVDVRIPENTTSIDMKFRYRDITVSHTVKQKSSMSSNFIQLQLTNKGLKAGQTATFTVEYTEDMPFLSYDVLSRGSVVITDRVPLSGQKTVTFTVPITTSMAPVAHIIAYYVRNTGEVVADSLSFSVDDFFDNKVSIAFSRNQSQPHENIDVLVTADPQSSVNLLAVDQSILLLKSGNGITPSQVSDELKSYGRGVTNGDFSPEVFSISSSSIRSADVFSDAGLAVITDAKYFNYYSAIPTGGGMMSGMISGSVNTAYSHALATALPPQLGVTETLQTSALKEVERVRKFFPETWLWLSQNVGVFVGGSSSAIGCRKWTDYGEQEQFLFVTFRDGNCGPVEVKAFHILQRPLWLH